MKVTYSDLKNKRVFISGGGSGIGATIVEYFCEQKSEVYFIDIDLKSSNKLIKKIKKRVLEFLNSLNVIFWMLKNYKILLKISFPKKAQFIV
jgi:NAD(P)-dependent dehydrogenase (short-subunit alcohol dehydrogenase family)